MNIISKYSELEELLVDNRCFIYPILMDPKKHYVENKVILLYVRVISTDIEYLVGFEHYDIPKVESLRDVLRSPHKHIVYKKKFVPYIDGYDADLMYWIYNFNPLPNETNHLNFFWESGLKSNLVPIYKLVSNARIVYDLISELPKIMDTRLLDRYQNFITQLTRIEQNGVAIDADIFNSVYNRNECGKIIYTEYNPYTLTGRPSNRFGGINFSALNKTDGSRKSFVSRFDTDGYLVEFDYNGYHINLIAKIIKYDFKERDVYTYFSELFKENDRERVKELVFQQIYGGVRKKYMNIRFFEKLNAYIDKLSNRTGIRSIFFKKPMPEVDSSIKLFNYLLQNLESEVNSIIISEINDYLKDKRTKFILYTYDSFLFDFCKDDGIEVLKDIRHILHKIGIRTSMKVGNNYQDMVIQE